MIVGNTECALCSRNFQNVKLSSTIKEFICHSILLELNFGEFKQSKNVIFGKKIHESFLWLCTMLQELSKCEVKARLCWNMIILPSLQFYVKSNFDEFKRFKNVIFDNFRNTELWIFGKFGTLKLLKFIKIKIQHL